MEWKHLMKPGLQAACEERGISNKGSKAEMIERLESHERSKNVNVQRFQALSSPRVHQPEAIRSEPIRPEPVRSNATRLVIPPETIRSEALQKYGASRQSEILPSHGAPPRHSRFELTQNSSYPDHHRHRGSESSRLPTPIDQSDVYNLTEAELEQLCRDNYAGFREDAHGQTRGAIIKAEFSTKTQDLYQARDNAIEEARNKCKEGVKNLAMERNNKFAVLNAEVDLWVVKQKIWTPAWKRLKEINAARGTFVTASKFNPNTHYSPAPESLPTPAASSSPRVSSLATDTVSTTTAGGKRRGDEADQDEVRYMGRRRISNDENATNSTKKTNPSRTDSPRRKSTTQSIRIALNYDPYVFLPDRTIRNEPREREAMASMLTRERFAVKRIRVDEQGFYWVFEDSRQGDREAEKCYEYFQGRLFNGEKMRLELHRRRAN